MYFPEENCSHVKQEKFSFESNCESNPKIPKLNKCKHLRFTSYQLNELKQIFDKNKNQLPSIYIRKKLAKKMGISEIKICNWFKYKVRAWKRISGSECKNESKNLLNQRKRFKTHELIELEQIFEKNHYPDKNIRNDLAQRMGISKVKIQKWFMDKRYKLKKHVPSSTNAGGGYVDFITSSTGDVNYPPASFYSQVETMPPDDPHRLPQFQSWPDFFATFSAIFSATFSAVQYLSHHVLPTHQSDSDHDHSEPMDLRLTASQLQ